mmetsp:Transcript_13208/g.25247  ORF Transcript_13208/g.25247 Transcript_13208/m.25247 type:complete len:620 (-) Transcript_13208:255-2114(-)
MASLLIPGIRIPTHRCVMGTSPRVGRNNLAVGPARNASTVEAATLANLGTRRHCKGRPERGGVPSAAVTVATLMTEACSQQDDQREAKAVPVSFVLPYKAEWGEVVCLVGGAPELGNWNVANALELTWTTGDMWKAATVLPTTKAVEFKFVAKNTNNGELNWQPTDNNVLELSSLNDLSGNLIEVEMQSWTTTNMEVAVKPTLERFGDSKRRMTTSIHSPSFASQDSKFRSSESTSDVSKVNEELRAAEEELRMEAMSRPPSVQFPADGTKRHGASVDTQTAVDVNLHDLYASQDSDVVQPWPVPSGEVQDAKTADASVEVESDVPDSLSFDQQVDIEQYDERARVSAQMAEVAKQIAESDPTAEGMDEATSLLQQVNTLKQYAQDAEMVLEEAKEIEAQMIKDALETRRRTQMVEEQKRAAEIAVARSKADVETAQVRAAAAEDAQRLAIEAAYVAYEDEATAEKAAREAQAIKEHAEDAVLRAWRQVVTAKGQAIAAYAMAKAKSLGKQNNASVSNTDPTVSTSKNAEPSDLKFQRKLQLTDAVLACQEGIISTQSDPNIKMIIEQQVQRYLTCLRKMDTDDEDFLTELSHVQTCKERANYNSFLYNLRDFLTKYHT